MPIMVPKLPSRVAQPPTLPVVGESNPGLTRSLRETLGAYLKGRKLVGIKIRQVEGGKVEGFLKIGVGKGERLLVDFKATTSPQGGITALEVGGTTVPLSWRQDRTNSLEP